MRVRKAKGDPLGDLEARVEPAFGESPDFMLALLLAIWTMLLEQRLPRLGGGGV